MEHVQINCGMNCCILWKLFLVYANSIFMKLCVMGQHSEMDLPNTIIFIDEILIESNVIYKFET